MYELKTIPRTDGTDLFTLLDDRNVMYIRPAIDGRLLFFDLVRLDIENGEIVTIAPRFWEINLDDEETAEDFILSAHYSKLKDHQYGKLLLTSYKGRLWNIDVSNGEVQTNGKNVYPAFGYPGSTPPRELVFPSPDLQRFVYQHTGTHRFEVVVPSLGESIHPFSFNDSTELMEPGIVWSPDSRLFFIEYGKRNHALGVYTDNGSLLFAQGIRFYDRDGTIIRTLELPSSKDKRVNVYGWADNGRVWLEFFRAVRLQDREPLKQDIIYKLYDIRSGKLTDYHMMDDLSKLQIKSVIKRHNGYSFRSLPFIIADTKNRLLWQPPSSATAIWSDDQLYIQTASEDISHVHSWNPIKQTWEWAASDLGENDNGNHRFAVPAAFQKQWLFYPRYSNKRIDYVRILEVIERNADGLPILSGEFADEQGSNEWWKDERYVKELDKTDIRAQGNSRYGTLQIVSEAGEIRLTQGGGPHYYGSYRVEFTNLQGEKKLLQPLVDLALHQEGSTPIMRKYEFDGCDVLLFQPKSFRFSKGFDGGVRKIIAYAITERGNAFPLDIQYAHISNELKRSLTFTIDDNVPVELDGENLIVHSLIGGRNYKLAIRPDLKLRTLTVVDAVDRSAEYKQLSEIASRYANRMEQALGLEDIDFPEGKMDEKQLRALFTNEAWNNPGFQHLRTDFAKSKQEGNPSRAFAWNPIDARFISPDTIRFTFTLNLWYAIGLAAHLEVGLKLVDGVWIFHDLGTLETEKLDGLPGYNGLLVRDSLEL